MKHSQEISRRLSVAEEEIKICKDLMKKNSGNIMDRIKTIQDACDYLGWDINNLPKYENPLTVVIAALNEDWIADWSDEDQPKYYNWFKWVSGVGLSYFDFVNTDSVTGVGSRLVFSRPELATYAKDQFPNEYKEWLLR